MGHPLALSDSGPLSDSGHLRGRGMVSLSSLDWNHALDWVVAVEELRQAVPLEPRNALVSL